MRESLKNSKINDESNTAAKEKKNTNFQQYSLGRISNSFLQIFHLFCFISVFQKFIGRYYIMQILQPSTVTTRENAVNK